MAKKRKTGKGNVFLGGLALGVVLATGSIFGPRPDLARALTAPASQPVDLATAQAEVYFSPRGGCTDAIVREINAAQRSIRVQAYSFTSAPIAGAIAKAHERGVDVQVVLDKSQRSEKYTSATFLANHGVPVVIDDRHAIAHNKIILIDDNTIITGSFNFSKAAEESNAENLLVIEGQSALAERYRENFEQHLRHSEAYEGPTKR